MRWCLSSYDWVGTKVAGDEARTVWGMGPLQKLASKRVEIGYNLSGRWWFVSLVRAESKQLEDVEGGHVLAGGSIGDDALAMQVHACPTRTLPS